MQNDISPENARALLQSTQQLRTHWSDAIIRLINYIVLLNVGVWSFFAKAYIDSNNESDKSLYILLAATFSTISLAAWRIYTHYLDDHITSLYPELLFYERKLDVPHNYGTARYLKKLICRLNHALPIAELRYKEKLISKLVEKRRVGSRGHCVFDGIAALITIGLIGLTCWATSIIPLPEFQTMKFKDLADANLLTILVQIWVFLILSSLMFYQRLPSKRFVKKTLNKLKVK